MNLELSREELKILSERLGQLPNYPSLTTLHDRIKKLLQSPYERVFPADKIYKNVPYDVMRTLYHTTFAVAAARLGKHVMVLAPHTSLDYALKLHKEAANRLDYEPTVLPYKITFRSSDRNGVITFHDIEDEETLRGHDPFAVVVWR